MQAITDLLSLNHERCDQLFAAVETAIGKDNATQAQTAFNAFHHAMQRHFTIEDVILFPAFEQNNDSDLGVTHMMRMEHEQMRELIEQIQGTLNNGNLQACASLAANLLPLIQQHNLKEEQVLYPLLDRALHDKTTELIQRIKSLPHVPG